MLALSGSHGANSWTLPSHEVRNRAKHPAPHEETHKNYSDFCPSDSHVLGCLHWPVFLVLLSIGMSTVSVQVGGTRQVGGGEHMYLRGAATHEKVFVGNFLLCSQMLMSQGKENSLRYPDMVTRSYLVSTHSKEGTQKDLI